RLLRNQPTFGQTENAYFGGSEVISGIQKMNEDQMMEALACPGLELENPETRRRTIRTLHPLLHQVTTDGEFLDLLYWVAYDADMRLALNEMIGPGYLKWFGSSADRSDLTAHGVDSVISFFRTDAERLKPFYLFFRDLAPHEDRWGLPDTQKVYWMYDLAADYGDHALLALEKLWVDTNAPPEDVESLKNHRDDVFARLEDQLNMLQNAEAGSVRGIAVTNLIRRAAGMKPLTRRLDASGAWAPKDPGPAGPKPQGARASQVNSEKLLRISRYLNGFTALLGFLCLCLSPANTIGSYLSMIAVTGSVGGFWRLLRWRIYGGFPWVGSGIEICADALTVWSMRPPLKH
ncbi:MAG: hypothetical protein HQL11_05345, partial [Candidatus Omnitrophica bacterium]|nr:hypothetical protein [Candidatus Omnitrophota bacterium]